jgi:ribonuclease P protein component
MDRIPEGEDFVGTVRRGKRVTTKHLRFMWRRNGRDASRLGISVGRKFGRAVARNRFKRLAREAFRLDECLRAAGLDIVIVAQNGAALQSPDEIVEGLKKVLERASYKERATRER